jgi:hypothetical protein
MEGYREAGLSAPPKDRVCIEEVGCTLALLRPLYAGKMAADTLENLLRQLGPAVVEGRNLRVGAGDVTHALRR